MTEPELIQCLRCGKENVDIHTCTSSDFEKGFNAAIEMVINSLDQYDSNELATMSVWDFIEKLKDDIIEEAEAYKNDK